MQKSETVTFSDKVQRLSYNYSTGGTSNESRNFKIKLYYKSKLRYGSKWTLCSPCSRLASGI